MHSAWWRSTFRRFLKFLQIKEGGLNFWGEPILKKVWIILSPLLCFNFKSFMDAISSFFIRFKWILHDSGVLFSECWNFYKLKSGDLISGGNQFSKNSELFRPPFCISTLKVLWTQIHIHSPDFNAFCNSEFRKSDLLGTPFCISILKVSAWCRSTFLWVLKFLQIKEGGPNFWG